MIFNVKRNAFLFTIGLVGFILFPRFCFAEQVTVDLIWKFPQPGWVEIEITEGIYDVGYNQINHTLQAGENIQAGQSSLYAFVFRDQKISVLEEPRIRFSTKDNGILRIREPGKDWVSYRGNLVIQRDGIHWKLANTLDREDYLKGVVPIEMSNAWAAKGYEALKAQAVAARTYLLKNVDSNGRITDSPNIHQAYWGRSVEGEASQAVDDTKGEILVDVDTNVPISIFYSAHNGGYSEETQNIWESHDPHYVAEPDPFSTGIGGMVDQWQFWIAADVLGKSFDLAPIRDVHLKKYTSGRVYEVELRDWLGNEKTVTGGDFVRKFYPYDRSISKTSFLGRLFEADYQVSKQKRTVGIIEKQEIGPVRSRFLSSNGGLSQKPRGYGLFVFNGRGWGHGAGMSQWGAYHMAMGGYTYQDILSYYYKNTKLVGSEN